MACFRIVPEQSELWAEARSTLHSVRVHTAGLTGVVEVEPGGERLLLATPTQVELEARRLRSGNALVDGELQRRIDTRAYSTIRAELTAVLPLAAADTLRLTGRLTLHGVTRTLDVEVRVRQPDPGTLEIEGGRSIDMRDFGLPAPSFLMFRMDPHVQIRARLVAAREQS
jgi:polyisoprenoid-binding protein YceI